MKPWLRKALSTLLAIEIIYLLLINLALNLPLTQKLVNQIRPDKFAVSWQSARSWYPFRVHATGVSANGQTGKQQWQVDSPEAAASINLIPLLWKSVHLTNVDVADAVFHLRPRPRSDKDFSNIRAYFAPIKNRKLETKPVAVPVKKKKKRWDIALDDIHASGNHHVWVYQLQAKLNGELEADINVQTGGGEFSLEEGRLDVNLDSVIINGDREIVRNGHIRGDLSFAPFVAKENKGLKALEFLSVDADINTYTDSLAFLNLYVGDFYDMRVSGRGIVDGHLNYQLGSVKQGNNLLITASELAVEMLDYRAQGEGQISIVVAEKKPDQMAFDIKFGALDGVHSISKEVLLSGDGISFSGKGRTRLLPLGGDESIASNLAVNIPSVKVPNLAAYQRFLPAGLKFKLLGGEGELQGKAELTRLGFSGDVRLSSTDANVGIKDFQFSSDLDMKLDIDAPALADTGLDVSASYLRISDARIANKEAGSSEAWQALIEIEKGRLKLMLPEGMKKDARLKELLAGIKGREILPMLDSDSEILKVRGMISDLGWLNVLLKNRVNLAIRGAGDITADAVVDSGWLAPGTEINIKPQKLGVDVLDYVIMGGNGGHLRLAVEKGGESPDLSLDMKISNASFRSRDDEDAFIENTDILLQATARNMSYEGPGEDIDLHLQIPSARVKDMAVYNYYLPPNSPLRIVQGQADLSADVMLQPETAKGFVKLQSTGLQGVVDNQQLEAELDVEIKLVGGMPRNMDFDITGSSLQIKNVKVSGNEESFNDDKWGVKFDLDKARARWKKPVGLDVKASFTMTDSRPFVAMMANHKGKHGWLGKALTIDDVSGNATMFMQDHNLIIPLAYADSEKITVGAKGLINADVREGIFYVRFKKLDGILKMRDGKRNLDILKARKTFDEYQPGKTSFKGSAK